MTRLCFFVQNHLAADTPRRLVQALTRGACDAAVFVGQDEAAGHGRAAEVERQLGVPTFALARRARRGYFSMVAPYFQAIDWLARQRVEYDWLIYLSGQDYPTQPLGALEAKLAASAFDGYLRFWPAFAADNPWRRRHGGTLRYQMQYFDLPGSARPLLHLVKPLNGAQRVAHFQLTYGCRVGLRWPGQPFRDGLACWAGKQWTVLRRECVERLAESAARHPKLMAWFERTICPDEAVVQTLLMAEGGLRLCDDDLRYVDFSGSRDGHPRLLDARDLPALADRRYFFARKVSPLTDPALLDRLDERLG